MSSFKNKNIVISGASRGIGLSISKRLAKEGANIAILAKTDLPHPKLPGTIFTAAKEIEKFGVKETLNKSKGMFSFAIYDAKKSLIFIARDRFGIKPLYYYFDIKF